MPESPDGQTIRRASDPAIEDSRGNVWRLTQEGHVTVDGFTDPGVRRVRELTYNGRMLWAFSDDDRDGTWRYKISPGDRWTVSDTPPPVPSGSSNAAVLDAIGALANNITGAFGQLSQQSARQAGGLNNHINIIADGLSAVQDAVGRILADVTPFDRRPASVRFGLPQAFNLKTGDRIPMALNILSDVVTNIPLVFDNAGGSPVSAPTGGTGSVSADNAAFTVALSADGQSIDVTPVQPPQVGQTTTITYTDTIGGQTLTATLPDVTIAADAAATSVHFDTTNVTTHPLPASP